MPPTHPQFTTLYTKKGKSGVQKPWGSSRDSTDLASPDGAALEPRDSTDLGSPDGIDFLRGFGLAFKVKTIQYNFIFFTDFPMFSVYWLLFF